jgi:hypothetical protein
MELIKIDTDHFVVVDDSEIKGYDWSRFDYSDFSEMPNVITHSTQPLDTIILKNRDHSQSVGHYYGNGGQLSLQEVKKLIGEVDNKTSWQVEIVDGKLKLK